MSGPPCVDPYRILGIAPSATDIEAKAAYRRLALLFHPDRNNSEMATEMMRIINLAHDAIRSPAARAEARRRAKPEPAKQEPASRRYVGDPCNFVMAFGKYRGRTLRDIEKIAPQLLSSS
jgi:curved DNA-binding protein CbpA